MKAKNNSSILKLLAENQWFWLSIAVLLFFFSFGKYEVGIAAWLYPAALYHYLRSSSPWKGYFIAFVVLVPLHYFIAGGIIPVPSPVLIGMGIFSTLLVLLVYQADRYLAPESGLLRYLLFPVLMTAFKFIESSLSPFGTWGNEAYSQSFNLPLLQLVSVTGIWGVSFLIYLGAPVLHAVLERRDEPVSGVRLGGPYVLLILMVMFLGGIRLALGAPDSPSLRIATIANSPKDIIAIAPELFTKVFTRKALSPAENIEYLKLSEKIQDRLLKATEKEAMAGARLVLWNEGAAPVPDVGYETFLKRARLIAQKYQITLGLGFSLIPSDKSQFLENKVYIINGKGEKSLEYNKHILVPGEEINFMRGKDAISHVRDPNMNLSYSAAICFDLDFPAYIRNGLQGADLFLVPAEDWKEVKHIHPRMARIRAIENGINLIRSTSRGKSIVSDSLGRILAVQDYFLDAERVMVAKVPTKGLRTLYSVSGDVLPWSCLLLSVFLPGYLIFRKRRKQGGD